MLKAYLPNNLNLDAILSTLPPEFTYEKDNFLYLISQVTERVSYTKDLVDGNGFISLNAQELQKKVRNYNVCMKYLVDNGVFYTDNHYIVGEKAKGYCFTEQYEQKVKSLEITKPSLIKQCGKKSEGEVTSAKSYNYLHKWFNDDINIDIEGALDYINEDLKANTLNKVKNAMLKHNASYVAATKFHNKEFSFSVDGTVGRLHTNLTNMKSELRNFITYNGKPLVSVDISNSQPCFAGLLLDEAFYSPSKLAKNDSKITFSRLNTYLQSTYLSNITDISLYIMLVKLTESTDNKCFAKYLDVVQQGKLYSYIAERIEASEGTTLINHKELKSMIFNVLFSDNRFIGQADAKPKRIFRAIFPEVYEVFKLIKKNDNSALPCILQAVEAKLMLDHVAKRISKENKSLPIFTIHDSIACPVGYEGYVASVIKEEMLLCTGMSPHLKFDYWKPSNIITPLTKAA
jgi:hypothetical protein